MHTKTHAHEILIPIFSTASKMHYSVPLFLVPAVARDPPPTPLHDALTTTQELLKTLIFAAEDRQRAWNDGDWTEIVQVVAKTRALLDTLDKSVRELKRYRKSAATTELQRSQIRRIEKLLEELRTSKSFDSKDEKSCK